MTVSRLSASWTVRRAWLCMVLTLLACMAVAVFVAVTTRLSRGDDGLQAFRHSVSFGLISYYGPRLLAVIACILCSQVKTQQAFLDAFALRSFPRRHTILALLLGLWIAFFVKIIEPGGIAHITFKTYFGITSLVILVGPFLEEVVARGFFYPAYRNQMSIVVSVILTFAVDTLFFHMGAFYSPRELLRVGLGNLAACLFREYTGSLWPSMMFHLGYTIPFSLLA